jgi:hypothetical protein
MSGNYSSTRFVDRAAGIGRSESVTGNVALSGPLSDPNPPLVSVRYLALNQGDRNRSKRHAFSIDFPRVASWSKSTSQEGPDHGANPIRCTKLANRGSDRSES